MVDKRALYGKALQLLRKARGKTQAETGNASGLSETAIGKIERGEQYTHTAQLFLLATYLRFDPTRFLNLTSTDPIAVMACLLPEAKEEEPGAGNAIA